MGGDCIGSDLVPLSTGRDYVKMVIDIACGREPEISEKKEHIAAIRFLMCKKDMERMEEVKEKPSPMPEKNNSAGNLSQRGDPGQRRTPGLLYPSDRNHGGNGRASPPGTKGESDPDF